MLVPIMESLLFSCNCFSSLATASCLLQTLLLLQVASEEWSTPVELYSDSPQVVNVMVENEAEVTMIVFIPDFNVVC